MAPTPITEDYYMVLNVDQTATAEQVNRSYRRLALKLHPDRNTRPDSTEAFQQLGRAYETLKDESKRRAYDLIYPSITRSRPSALNTQTPRPPPAATPQSGALSEEAHIAALQKSTQERGARWQTKKNTFDSSIFEVQRAIRRLEQEIKNLNSIAAAEVAEDAQKNSWSTWLLSPIYKQAEVSEEEKARKDRERQERRIEKDMKERRLGSKKADLKKEENLLKLAKEDVDALDLVDNGKIRALQERIRVRETRQRQERERVESERRAKIWKQEQEQQKKREQEAAEALRKQQAEERAAQQKRQEVWRKQQAEHRAAEQERQEAQAKMWQNIMDDEIKYAREKSEYFFTAEESTRQSTSTCSHGGWWPKVQGRAACPTCYESWTYLLQCPGCEMKACPRCQAAIRRRKRNSTRTNPRAAPKVGTPSPELSYYHDPFY